MRRRLPLLAVAACIGCVVVGVAHLAREHLGPFATGTKYKALLAATWEMSPSEVERALGWQLLSFETYKAWVQGEPYLDGDSWATELGPEWAEHAHSLYVPRRSLFNESCDVQFQFYDDKLTTIVIAYKPGADDQPGLIGQIRGVLAHDFRPVQEGRSATGLSFFAYYTEVAEALLLSEDKSVTLFLGYRRFRRPYLHYLDHSRGAADGVAPDVRAPNMVPNRSRKGETQTPYRGEPSLGSWLR